MEHDRPDIGHNMPHVEHNRRDIGLICHMCNIIGQILVIICHM
jgi:hypothetical protein